MIRMPDSFAGALIAPFTVRRALVVAAVVGTILVAINQGDAMMAGRKPAVWKVLLTYCVPYCVSSFSTAMFALDLARGRHVRG